MIGRFAVEFSDLLSLVLHVVFLRTHHICELSRNADAVTVSSLNAKPAISRLISASMWANALASLPNEMKNFECIFCERGSLSIKLFQSCIWSHAPMDYDM